MSPRWKQTFKPIVLKDGRTIRSLEEARSLMLTLPQLHQQNAHWQYASELLISAADRNEKYSTMDARAQLSRALTAEGLL
jgi:uncharacterized protein HemY